jgi:hypothetical protein
VAVRVSPTEAVRAQIHELFESGGELLSVVEQVARLSVRLTFQSVIEEIVCEELGRGRYQRRTGTCPRATATAGSSPARSRRRHPRRPLHRTGSYYGGVGGTSIA